MIDQGPCVLVTGATGFIGRHLVPGLSNHGYRLRLGLRRSQGREGALAAETAAFDLADSHNDFDKLLKDVDVIIHLAGLAHRKSAGDAEYLSLNTRGTARLAEEAAARGVGRFIFLSTVKVHGETGGSVNDFPQAVTERTPVSPVDGYSKSKRAAEEEIIRACQSSGMEYVILRPPLIFGPGVRANFLALLRVVSRGYPLPLAGIDNQRSLIYVENLVDLIMLLIPAAIARNQVYLVKDVDFSTPGLATEIAQALGKTARLFALPPGLLKVAGGILNKGEIVDRLTGSLFIDDSKVRTDLAWAPPVDSHAAMQRTINWFKVSRQYG